MILNNAYLDAYHVLFMYLNASHVSPFQYEKGTVPFFQFSDRRSAEKCKILRCVREYSDYFIIYTNSKYNQLSLLPLYL